MKVAFVGKGGAGKSALAGTYARARGGPLPGCPGGRAESAAGRMGLRQRLPVAPHGHIDAPRRHRRPHRSTARAGDHRARSDRRLRGRSQGSGRPWHRNSACLGRRRQGAGRAFITSSTWNPSFIKLDTSWVRGIERDPTRQALVRGLSQFSKRTGAELIAEGIETESQLAKLIELDVRLGQGFHIGRPSPTG